ncbi:MAG: YbaB/EbfC family nucleoid-associated protein [Bacillales bacterium]|nr:YbaB/EbfC family nucleoid-associated protein [Bacillales bacterium]MDY6003225.1 YbaB/EbfC family nucleoid-associated protein [Bacilli bacterium]
MNMQQMLMQAQKMQRELAKAQAQLAEKEFTVSKGGAVTVVLKGDKTVVSVSVDEDAFDKDNKEMVEEMIVLAINEAQEKIDEESEAINEKITGRPGGLGF